MKTLDLIKALINLKNDPRYYTFRKAEHETVLLKRLEDNKIFYNNAIYDKDFFYYHKLEGFMEQIYQLRDEYIQDNFHKLIVNESPSPRPRERIKLAGMNSKDLIKKFINSLQFWKQRDNYNPLDHGPLIRFIKYDPNNCDEITGLVKAQYDILVKAYKYEFSYDLPFDLLNPKIRFTRECDWYKPLMKDYFYDWFYILGWKSIKPVYQTFGSPLLWHYDDDYPLPYCRSLGEVWFETRKFYDAESEKVPFDFERNKIDYKYFMSQEKLEFFEDELKDNRALKSKLELNDPGKRKKKIKKHQDAIESVEAEYRKIEEEIHNTKEEIAKNKIEFENMLRDIEKKREEYMRLLYEYKLQGEPEHIKAQLDERKAEAELFKKILEVYEEEETKIYKREPYSRQENLIFKNRYKHIIETGTRFDPNWIEEKYDEQKKFSEFDINCKTNSYYTRYIAYNEIYNKDYPEDKKFKTDLIHDFTEEEIQENYENMIDKEKSALDKFNFVMFNEKRRTVVLKFFEELEVLEVSREKLIYDFHWNEEEDSHMWLNKELDDKLYEILNDPRNLLIMPLIDAYFEVFRNKGYWHADESFSGIPPAPAWGETGAHKKFFKYLKYFDLSYERQYISAKNMWLIDDYMDIEDEEYDEYYEDEHEVLGYTLIVFIWLAILNFYVVIVWFFGFEVSLNGLRNSLEYFKYLNLSVFGESKADVEMRQLVCPEIYYGLELRRPRARLRTNRTIFPFRFYENSYYSYSRKRVRNLLPMTFLDQLSYNLDEKDYGLSTIDHELRMHGRRYYIWKFRVPYVEEPWQWSFADPSPWMRFKLLVKNIKKYLTTTFALDKHLKTIAIYIQVNYAEPYWVYHRAHIRPEFLKLRALLKTYKRQGIEFCMEVIESVKKFFKKNPTN